MKKLEFLFNDSPETRSAVTVGSFDGVHRGHQEIIQQVLHLARDRQAASTLVTFDPHPRQVIEGIGPAVLTTLDEKVRLARRFGIERLAVLPFDEELASWKPERFVEELLVAQLDMTSIVLGPDHRFGQQREGDDVLLEEMGLKLGFSVHVVGPMMIDQVPISSSSIRDSLRAGKVKNASNQLGYFYQLYGTVVKGDSRGKKIGFPTANLIPEANKLVPANGVYAVLVSLPDESRYKGMLNIGKRPTFGGTSQTVEVHILQYEGDLYGREVRVEFVERVRNEHKFESADALIAQLKLDRERCTAALKTVP